MSSDEVAPVRHNARPVACVLCHWCTQIAERQRPCWWRGSHESADRTIKTAWVVIEVSGSLQLARRRQLQFRPAPKFSNVRDHHHSGFWNSHVHFMERKWADVAKIHAGEVADALQMMLTRYGFTSVFDIGSSWENTRRLRDRIESGEIAGPRIRSTGEFLVPKGGSARDLVFDIRGAMHINTPELSEPNEGAAAAKRLIDAGVDGIKLYVSTGFPPVRVLSDSVSRSGQGRPRTRQPFLLILHSRGLMAALRGGADILVHTAPQAGDWDDLIIDAMKKTKVALIPTLHLWEYELRHDRSPVRARFATIAIEQLERWNRVGGIVLFGTDVGYHSHYDPTGEYVLMAEAGMSGREILASLTTAPAEQFGESSRLGRIAPGYLADLVVLRDDPIQNVRAFADLRYTIRDGRIIQ